MARRFLHHDAAFEHLLRAHRVPYIAVDEARRTLLPNTESLKSFDFLVSTPTSRLLVEVKGRTWRAPAATRPGHSARSASATGRLESWATLDDVEALRAWQRLLVGGFSAALAFLYLCDAEPPDTLFDEAFEFKHRWYGLRTVAVDDYARCMRPRSERWRTVDVAPSDFARLRLPVLTPTRCPAALSA